MDLLWLDDDKEQAFVPVKNRGTVYIAEGEDAEWVQHVNLSESEVTERITSMPEDATSIVSFAWPDGSYLSIRRQPENEWQMMSRARIGLDEVLTHQLLDEQKVLKTAVTFATFLQLDTVANAGFWESRQVPPWKKGPPWRPRKPEDDLWTVSFRKRFPYAFWKKYAIWMALFIAGMLAPIGGFLNGAFYFLVLFGALCAAMTWSVVILGNVWLLGLRGMGWVFGEVPSVTPVPVLADWVTTSQGNGYALGFSRFQPPWKHALLYPLFALNLVVYLSGFLTLLILTVLVLGRVASLIPT